MNSNKPHKRDTPTRSITERKTETLTVHIPFLLCFLNPSPHRKQGSSEEYYFSRPPQPCFPSLSYSSVNHSKQSHKTLGPHASRPSGSAATAGADARGPGPRCPVSGTRWEPRLPEGSDTDRGRGGCSQTPAIRMRSPRGAGPRAGGEETTPGPPHAGRGRRATRYSPTRSETSPKFRRAAAGAAPAAGAGTMGAPQRAAAAAAAPPGIALPPPGAGPNF